MKFVRYIKNGINSYGLVENEKIRKIDGDIFSSYKLTDNLINIDEVELLTPCCPTKIICVGVNYKSHALEMGMELPKEPLIFLKPTTAAIAHNREVVMPAMSERVDYEGEVAFVIGEKGFNIKEEDASKYIFGATCFNDITARDLQQKDGQWTRAKSFDTFAPFGPCIVTDLDWDNLNIEFKLNGVRKQRSNTSDFIFKSNRIVSFISQIMTLNPGDIIATGTPSGIGPVKSRDIMEVIIEGVGTLENPVR